jgi:drug/metabolite transporter (DMT)-like permease
LVRRDGLDTGLARVAVADAKRDRVTQATGQDVDALRAPTRREHVPLGILYMVGATLVFAVSSATSKWLVDIYPVGEVLFTRAGISLIACALFILPQTGLAVFRTQRRRDHVMRSLSQTVSQTFLLIAFSLMPLASAVAINFSAPLFTALVAILMLKEPVGFARWFALIVGFLGVLIVTHPGAETFQIGALFALANALIYGSVTAAVRGMTATESAETLLMYQLLLITAFFSLLLPFGVAAPTWADAGLMLFNGVTNAIGQYWWTRALHLAPASAVTPFFYLSLVWAAVLGFVVWGDVPTVGLLVGSAVVVGSGLFLLWREQVRL